NLGRVTENLPSLLSLVFRSASWSLSRSISPTMRSAPKRVIFLRALLSLGSLMRRMNSPQRMLPTDVFCQTTSQPTTRRRITIQIQFPPAAGAGRRRGFPGGRDGLGRELEGGGMESPQ